MHGHTCILIAFTKYSQWLPMPSHNPPPEWVRESQSSCRGEEVHTSSWFLLILTHPHPSFSSYSSSCLYSSPTLLLVFILSLGILLQTVAFFLYIPSAPLKTSLPHQYTSPIAPPYPVSLWCCMSLRTHLDVGHDLTHHQQQGGDESHPKEGAEEEENG